MLHFEEMQRLIKFKRKTRNTDLKGLKSFSLSLVQSQSRQSGAAPVKVRIKFIIRVNKTNFFRLPMADFK